ncbi:Hypothetical protein R9X50_00573500 [Acrodontium crateriforme]|uniref:Glucosidase 2 subunit beta n=1 Tax=Acrodontium crateriforme TaxID=150365 RepID=A0AAQ3MCV1_9PEZI|nr:Hypothetical protein R9X50_00573500 [Acrodontium crateriforme]
MKRVAALLCLGYASAVYAAPEVSRPRGVGPEFAKFYKDHDTFSCIAAPSIIIPFNRVNDDYCDCPDGSDEPGTSACAHLSPLSPRTPADAVPHNIDSSLALPGFYCKNKGHIPGYIPFTRVNDGICDYEVCCDGSEEWEGIGGIKCENRCKEIGKEWRKQDEIRQKALGNAARKRKELVATASRLRKELQDRIKTLTAEVAASEKKVQNLERDFNEIERKEKGKIVRGANSPKAGKLGVLVGLAKQRTEELRTSLERVRRERDSSKSRLQELENLLSTFKEEYNPNFNDEGVKRAVRGWEDYAARDKGPESEPALDRDLDEITKSDKENGLDWDEYEGDEENEIDVLYSFENYLPPFLREWVDQKLRDLRVMLIENGILAERSSSSESRVVTDARSRLESARTELGAHRNSVKSLQEDLDKDFGPDDVFRALKGECISTDSGEYTYEVCFMGQTTQKPKKGGGNVNMGNFVGIDRITVDDELPANGKGVGSGERIVMKHENGQHCWNGPNRSTMVVLACSEENEVWKIVEEEKCVYRMEVGTPAVCESSNGAAKAESAQKDEL